MPSALRPSSSNDIEGDRIKAAWINSSWWLRSRQFPAVRSRRAHLARQRSILIGRRALMKWVSRGCLVVLCALLCRCTAEPPVVATPAQPRRLPFTYEAGQNGMHNGGVRAILQDRSGNYWFGSHFEGVCRFDGERFQCFTIADGLSDNQVRSIQEDARGTIWFDNGVGISSYPKDGKSVSLEEAIKLLTPLCPNCHRIAHAKPGGGTYTVAEITAAIPRHAPNSP
jgi:hypothetical protein